MESQSSGQASASSKLLSCLNCRRRKVKCDKLDPCSPCARYGIDCVFPNRKRRRNAPREDALLHRLAKLEAMVAQADVSLSSAASAPPSTPFDHLSGIVDRAAAAVPEGLLGSGGKPNPVPPSIRWGDTRHEGSNNAALGLARQSAGTAEALHPAGSGGQGTRFISADFWANLCGEVEGLKQALEQPSSDSDGSNGSDREDDAEDSPQARPSLLSPTTTSAIFGNPEAVPATAPALDLPSPEQIVSLCTTYFSNFDPVVKILHRPTFMGDATSLARSGAKVADLHPAKLALLFAVFLGAVTSINATDCASRFGEAKDILAKRYLIATEAALAKADFLNSSRIESLQAFTIYVACLRCHSGRRASWVLLSMAIRLAHALGLHRDGDGSRLTPFMAEMRRRLWWQLIVLDIRGAEDRGSEAVSPDSYDTAMMTNINDDDFGPETKGGPLVGREGPSDVTFSLCTAMCSRAFLHIRSSIASFYSLQSPGDEEAAFVEHVRHLERLFIDNVDPTHPTSALAAHTLRIIILKLWLSIQYPFEVRPMANKPLVSREAMIRTALSVLELTEASKSVSGCGDRFLWWTDTYVQWHPLAVALAELCHQTKGELVERAWRVVDRVFPIWSDIVADTKKGMLWRPIKRLLRKAKSAREKALAAERATGPDQPVEQAHDPDHSDENPEQANDHPAGSIWSPEPPALDGIPDLASPYFLFPLYPAPENTMGTVTQDLSLDLNTLSWTNWNEFVNDANNRGSDSEARFMIW